MGLAAAQQEENTTQQCWVRAPGWFELLPHSETKGVAAPTEHASIEPDIKQELLPKSKHSTNDAHVEDYTAAHRRRAPGLQLRRHRAPWPQSRLRSAPQAPSQRTRCPPRRAGRQSQRCARWRRPAAPAARSALEASQTGSDKASNGRGVGIYMPRQRCHCARTQLATTAANGLYDGSSKTAQ